MRFTNAQQTLLLNTDAKSKCTSADLAAVLESYPGPAVRSAHSLVKHGLMKQGKNKDGDPVFSRTAAGGKVAKTF